MAELPVSDVPTTVVTGFLGAGKTTAILDLLRHRPEGQRWAVLVNEFGDVGIDGAALSEVGGLAVREVPGGCICCTAGLELKVGLVRLLREVRPDRLFVEPSGLAHPAAIVDVMRSPGLREAIAPRATIGLVDPRRLSDPRIQRHETFHDQLQLADVLVATHGDDASAADLAAFAALAEGMYPPKVAVSVSAQGALDPAWLDLDPAPREVSRAAHLHLDAVSHGWIFPPSQAFDRDRLELALQELVRPNPALPAGVLRLKGVFRTPRAWLLVNATPDEIRWRPLNYRRDSRVEIIAPRAPAPDWAAAERVIVGAGWRREG